MDFWVEANGTRCVILSAQTLNCCHSFYFMHRNHRLWIRASTVNLTALCLRPHALHSTVGNYTLYLISPSMTTCFQALRPVVGRD